MYEYRADFAHKSVPLLQWDRGVFVGALVICPPQQGPSVCVSVFLLMAPKSTLLSHYMCVHTDRQLCLWYEYKSPPHRDHHAPVHLKWTTRKRWNMYVALELNLRVSTAFRPRGVPQPQRVLLLQGQHAKVNLLSSLDVLPGTCFSVLKAQSLPGVLHPPNPHTQFFLMCILNVPVS